MNWNILLIIVFALFVLKMIGGCKKGMVKEIISMVSLIVLCAVLMLVAFGVHSYFDGAFWGVAAAVFLLVLLVLLHHLINLAIAPLKILSKLPIINIVDKLLGVIFGLVEVWFLLWTLYALLEMFEMGKIGEWILTNTEGSAFLTWMYENNYLARWVEGLVGNLRL